MYVYIYILIDIYMYCSEATQPLQAAGWSSRPLQIAIAIAIASYHAVDGPRWSVVKDGGCVIRKHEMSTKNWEINIIAPFVF